jgi:HSP20 family protein
MNLIKKEFFPTLPRLFDDFFGTDLNDWGFRNFSTTNTTLPAVNIVESDDRFTVEMAAPGMTKKDFQIELDNEILTISSEKEVSSELDENDKYSRREFSYQSFRRTFQLPKTVVDDSRIEAAYENGILTITIPKREEARAVPPRKIAIR